MQFGCYWVYCRMKEWTLTKVYKCIPFSCDKKHKETQKEGNIANKEWSNGK